LISSKFVYNLHLLSAFFYISLSLASIPFFGEVNIHQC
jgi:hypothetical protein